MSAEDQKETKQVSSSTFYSLLSEIQKVITEFNDGIPDSIDKILRDKLPPSTQPYDQENMVSLLAPADREIDPEVQHIPPKPEQDGLGVVDTPPKITRNISSFQRQTSFPQTSRDIGSPQTNKDVGSCIKIRTEVGSGVNKEDSSSELFQNRKMHLPNTDANQPTTSPIK